MVQKASKTKSLPSRDSVGTSQPANVTAKDRIFWWRMLWGICVVQFVLLVLLTLWHFNSPLAKQPLGKLYSTTTREPFFLGHSGPWGDIEYIRINVEPPDEFLPTGSEPLAPTRWTFSGYSREQLRAFIASCELTAAQRKELMDETAWSDTPEGVVVLPRDALILDLSSSARRQIYSILAGSDLNPAQFQPYAFRNGGFDDWFFESGLSEPTLTLIRRLVYQRGSAICFSDALQVLPQIHSVEERKRLVKTLWRNPAVLMKIRVRPGSDTGSIADYWSRGWHVKDIDSLLGSLRRVPGSITLDVAHLLPPFARRRLNSYPNPATYTPAQAPDCFWSAFNFFSDTPDDRFHEKAGWQQELKENYVEVKQPTFGDVMLFEQGDGTLVHAASYVADDVAFTKNGDDFRQPWVLMKTDDLLARYGHTEGAPLRLRYYRTKVNKD